MRHLAILGSNKRMHELFSAGFLVTSFSRSFGTFFDVNEIFTQGVEGAFDPSCFDFFLINIGLLQGCHIIDSDLDSALLSYQTNCLSIVRLVEELLRAKFDAKILIIGSESAEKGSYDTSYFLGKAALTAFVLERQVSSDQQLNIVSPSMIEDGGMTLMREDQWNVDRARQAHPKGALLTLKELCRACCVIFECPYICNENIRINGGKFARMQVL